MELFGFKLDVWILNLVGIAMFGVLVEILLPKGETSKYIKGIFALFCVFIIISPITSLFSKDLNFKELIAKGNKISVDNEFVEQTILDSNEEQEVFLENEFDKLGYKNVKIDIVADIPNKEKISYVKVSLKNLVIDENIEHISINKNITEIITKRLKIKEDKVKIYE